MTPLFAASLASQPGQTQTDGGTAASVEVGVVRATQHSVAFTPTQGMGLIKFDAILYRF